MVYRSLLAVVVVVVQIDLDQNSHFVLVLTSPPLALLICLGLFFHIDFRIAALA